MKQWQTYTSLIILLGSVISQDAIAQREVIIDNTANANSNPLYTLSHENTNGTPYLDEKWHTGTVRFADGHTLNNISLRYNQVTGIVTFEKKGKEFEFSKPLKEFQYTDDEKSKVLFRNGFDPSNAFYQVLHDGKTLLLKRSLKRRVEKTPFNSATTTVTFEPTSTYYIYSNNKLMKVKTNRKNLSSILADKTGKLNTYFEEHPDFDSEENLVKLIVYYDSI